MLDTGLRSSEAVNLKWEHVNLMSGKLMVKEGKGAKDRNLWLDADNIDLLCVSVKILTGFHLSDSLL